MNIKDLITWSLKRWWWFAISLVFCIGIGALVFLSSAPKREVGATIMLRSTEQGSQQGEMMNLMGVDGNKQAMDEIKVLTSRDLMEQIVDSFHLNVVVQQRVGLRWIPVYPFPNFAQAYDQPVIRKTTYKTTINEDKYRIVVYPHIVAVDRALLQVNVSRLARESQVITLSMNSANPEQAVAILDMLLDLYNNVSVRDKNAIALQTQSFLDERLTAVQKELSDVEIAMEVYKTQHQITDIDKTATEYQSLIESYQQQLANINLNLRKLDNLDEQLKQPLVDGMPRTLYGNFVDETMSVIVSDYNANVTKRIALMESATEQNPMVQMLDKVMAQQRLNIANSAQDARTSMQIHQKHLTEQINKYASALAQLPEQEREYLELLRDKQTKEEQYIYLIEKREENALLLVSSIISAKVVDKAQMSAKITSPSIMKIGAASVLFGLLLPLLVFFFGVFKKELM